MASGAPDLIDPQGDTPVIVTMLVTISGTRDGADWPRRGQVLNLPDGEAADLIAAGLAEPAGVESAAAEPAESAAMPKARKRT